MLSLKALLFRVLLYFLYKVLFLLVLCCFDASFQNSNVGESLSHNKTLLLNNLSTLRFYSML